jgi:hypothetical protein
MRYLKLLLLFIVLAISCRKEVAPVPAVINSFTPDKGGAGNLVSIIGEKFGEDSLKTTISFNGRSVTNIIQYTDTLIIVAVPPGTTTGKISISIDGTTTISVKDFVILPGTWVRKKDNAALNFDIRSDGIAFSVGNTGYYGMGYNGGTTIKDIASYDASTDTWKRLPDGGLDFQSGIVMVINNKVYTGLGQAFSLNPSIMKQIWEFDPSNNTWTRKKDFPGTARWAAIGIALGDKGYVGLGDPGGGSILRDWWEYDPAADNWTQKKDNPSLKPLQWSAGFTINGRIFVGISAYLQSNEWYEYIPSTDNWIRRADFPGRIVFSPASFVIGNKGYVAGGGDECWAYDPSSDSWTQQAFIRQILAGRAFVLNNKGYFLTGVGGGGSTNSNYWNKEVWEFTPGN